LCHAALSGAAGAIGTFFNVWGEPAQRARKAFINGDYAAGRRFMAAFQVGVSEVLKRKSIWTFLQSAMRIKFGIDVGMPRAPLGTQDKQWDDGDVEQLIERIDAAAPPKEA